MGKEHEDILTVSYIVYMPIAFLGSCAMGKPVPMVTYAQGFPRGGASP
jgi:hypothetical protein